MEIQPTLVGDGVAVPLLSGETTPHINFDFAASAPALTRVAGAVEAFLPWYSSVHRGAGWKSRVSTEVYEASRKAVGAFCGARSDDVVVFTANTTGALNVLASAVPDDYTVVTFNTEHHANLLPWRPCVHIRPGSTAAETLEILDRELQRIGGPVLVSVTAASNVTGEIWPISEITSIARRHGARICVDAAQLAPHARVDISAWDADWVAISGHKLYAPYGAGALVGRRDWLERAAPHTRGGGAVVFVTDNEVMWSPAPERHEAGSPNVVGCYALGVACDTLSQIGFDQIEQTDQALGAHLRQSLEAIPEVRLLRLWEDPHPRTAVAAFTVEGWHHTSVATVLSAEHGISVRDGCFCAHPLLLDLMDVSPADAERIRDEMAEGNLSSVPGAIRASCGISTTIAEIDELALAVKTISASPGLSGYEFDPRAGECRPLADPRDLPPLPLLNA